MGGKVKMASRNEVMSQTDVKYFSDLPATIEMKHAELSAYVRQMQFLDKLKNSPMFEKEIGTKSEDAPRNWRSLDPKIARTYPSLQQYKFNPKYAEVLEDHIRQGFAVPEALSLVTNGLMKSIMLSPVPHIHNEGIHWFTDRGLVSGWANPKGWAALAKTFPKAWNSVKNQDALQQALQRHGMTAMYASVKNDGYWNKLVQNELDKVTEDGVLHQVADHIGIPVANLYNAISKVSSESMWFVRDTMATQLVLERMDRHGMDMDSAITSVQKHMPSYRLPPRMGEKVLSKVLSEDHAAELSRGIAKTAATQPLAMFSRYHYGRLSSWGNMIKELATGTGFEKAHALDSFAALTFLYCWALPNIGDKIVQTLTGSEDAKMRRAGPLHEIEAVRNLAEGKEGSIQALMISEMSAGPALTIPMATVNQKDPRTGQPIVHESDWRDAEGTDETARALGRVTKDEFKYMMNSVFAPAKAINSIGSDSEDSWKAYIASQALDTDIKGYEKEEKSDRYSDKEMKKRRRKLAREE
jgi:hypothetical protein